MICMMHVCSVRPRLVETRESSCPMSRLHYHPLSATLLFALEFKITQDQRREYKKIASSRHFIVRSIRLRDMSSVSVYVPYPSISVLN